MGLKIKERTVTKTERFAVRKCDMPGCTVEEDTPAAYCPAGWFFITDPHRNSKVGYVCPGHGFTEKFKDVIALSDYVNYIEDED